VSTSTPITATAASSRPDGTVDNDATLEIYARAALAQAAAGAQVVAPSGMMDGQVAVIRDALDSVGFTDVADDGLRGEVRERALRPVP
jgi:delta-aminolevulinic acid dehydratase/porphobilinogen synthase